MNLSDLKGMIQDEGFEDAAGVGVEISLHIAFSLIMSISCLNEASKFLSYKTLKLNDRKYNEAMK